MFVEVPGRDSTPGSSSGTGGQLSSTLASPKDLFSRNDMSSAVTRVTENGYSVPKQEPMETELAPVSTTVAAAAVETITGIDTTDYHSHDMELESLPSPVSQGELGQPGYYTEQDIRKLYWQWRTHQEAQKFSGQQSNSDDRDDRDDVSMGGADEGDAHDGGGTSRVWTGSQHEDQHLRDGPGLHPSSQERDDGIITRNKGKSRKVEKAGRYEDDVPKKERDSKDATGSWGSEEDEDDDGGEDDGEDEEDGDEEGDDGYCESDDGDDGEDGDDSGAVKPRVENWEDGKAAVARRTRTQTGRREQLRSHSKSSSTAPSRAGTSASGDGPRRSRAKDEKKHGCDDCHKRFSRPSQLRTHQLTHSGEKPYHCHLCDKDFNVASNLKRHIRTHDRIPRKNSRDGSGVFRGFTQGFQAKHSSSWKASSSDAGRKARSAKTNVGTSTGIARRAAGTNQPLEKLRWMSTETPESSKMAASRQAKNTAIRQKTAEAGSSTSRPGRNTPPSETIAPTNAQPAAAVDVGAAVSVARLSNLTGGTAVGDRAPQPLPPPTPRPSRESDSESTLVDGTQASDGDEDMGDSIEPSPGGSNINQRGER
ncbi:hypothetical protein EC968_009900 [Mortierella alpina]|nr:hypothetical protein EC968_009900 [Mortierella alpina]